MRCVFRGESSLHGLAALGFGGGRRWAIAGVRRGQEATFPQALGLPVGLGREAGQFPVFQAPKGIPLRARPPTVHWGFLGIFTGGAAGVDVEPGPGVAIPSPGAPGEYTGIPPEGGVPLAIEGLEGLSKRRFLVDAVLCPSEVAPSGGEGFPMGEGEGPVQVVAQPFEVAHVPEFRPLVPQAWLRGLPTQFAYVAG